MAGVTPRESALPRVKTRRHVTPHVMSAEGEKYTSCGCAAGSSVSMSQGSERQQEVERERAERNQGVAPTHRPGDEVLTSDHAC